MKYLKNFNESIESDLYERIFRDAFLSYRSKRVDMEKKYIKIIHEIFKNNSNYQFDYYDNHDRDNIGGCEILNFKTAGIINISQLPDDYFLISCNFIFYRCDQIDGLKKCLNEML